MMQSIGDCLSDMENNVDMKDIHSSTVLVLEMLGVAHQYPDKCKRCTQPKDKLLYRKIEYYTIHSPKSYLLM